MPGDLGESLLQEMLSASFSVPLASVSVLGVQRDVTDGNNFTSDMSRLRARVTTEDGDRKEVSLLVKQALLEELDNQVLKDAAQLTTEIKMYREILPNMERLLIKFDREQDCLWAHCIGHLDNTTLVLEDLRELGYQTCDRIRGLDFQHALIAIRGLARFHASSVALQEAGQLQTKDFSKFIFSGNSEAMNGFITSSFNYLHMVAALEWSAEWRDIISNIRRIPEMVLDKLREITRLDDCSFHVLNHGDPWVNNMMFRRGKDGSPDSVRFVDFQLSHYNSYAFDLHYLLNTSLSTEVLPHMDRLYEEYLNQLGREFSKLCIKASCPTREDLLQELERTEFFGLFSAVCILPVITAGAEIAPLKDSTGYSLAELEMRKKERFRTEEYTRRIQVILRRAQHGGLFKRLFV